MADSHLRMLRWALHSIPQNAKKFLLGLFVTSGDSCLHKDIDNNTEALATIFLDFLQGITLEVGDDRRFRALRYPIPRFERLNHLHLQ